jgi:hypothetical protein
MNVNTWHRRPDRKPFPVVAKRSGILLAKRPLAAASMGDCLGVIAWDDRA